MSFGLRLSGEGCAVWDGYRSRPSGSLRGDAVIVLSGGAGTTPDERVSWIQSGDYARELNGASNGP